MIFVPILRRKNVSNAVRENGLIVKITSWKKVRDMFLSK